MKRRVQGGVVRAWLGRDTQKNQPEVHPFVVAELLVCHVPVVPDDLAHVLRRHVLLLRLHEPKLPLLAVPLGLQLLPFLG